MTIGCRRAFISASSVSGSFPGAGVAGTGFWGRMLTRSSFEDDVVDQTGGADAHRAGEDGRVEVRDLDVVDLEPVRGRELGERLLAIAGHQGPRESERPPTFLLREQDVPRGEGEAVLVADGRDHAHSTSRARSRISCRMTADLLRVLLTEVRARRLHDPGRA